MRQILKLAAIVALVGGALWLLRASGPFLIIDRPEVSDALVILAGDENDIRLHHAEDLLRQGYARHGFINAENTSVNFGRTPAQDAEAYLSGAPEDLRTRMSVCAMAADSTVEEILALRPCLDRAGAHKVLMVTSDFHTRRSLSVAKKLLPQYEWRVAAARGAVSQPQWWKVRAARREVLLEWEKMVWWKLVESHR